MMYEPLCALCVYATFHSASLVAYVPPDGSRQVLVNERGEAFVRMVLQMHHTPTDLRAVTTVGGTAVCPIHIADALERATAPNGRRW